MRYGLSEVICAIDRSCPPRKFHIPSKVNGSGRNVAPAVIIFCIFLVLHPDGLGRIPLPKFKPSSKKSIRQQCVQSVNLFVPQIFNPFKSRACGVARKYGTRSKQRCCDDFWRPEPIFDTFWRPFGPLGHRRPGRLPLRLATPLGLANKFLKKKIDSKR